MECDVCGSHNVRRHDVEGHLLEECGLCGNLQGDDEAVALIEELRRGRERGLDDEVIPLVSVLESSGAFRVLKASAGEPEAAEPPHVLLTVIGNDTRPIERLLRSVELSNRETRLRWLIELTLQHEVVYILRARFWKIPSSVTAAEIQTARADLPLLARNLRRHLALSWWRD
jgi:hypothetical protein